MSELVAHLDRQVRSTRRLLGIVISQATAIRERVNEQIAASLGLSEASPDGMASLDALGPVGRRDALGAVEAQ